MIQTKITHALTAFLLLTGFIACKPSSESETGYDPNDCNGYACPVHKDKLFVVPDKCPECGRQMISKNAINSILDKIKQSSLDSLDLYHKLMIEQSGRIMRNDSSTKEEQISYLAELAKNLTKAKTVNENLDQLVYGKRKLMFKPRLKKLERLYAVATYRINSLSNELARNDYSKGKVKLYANEFREVIYVVDKEQHSIRVE